MAISYDSLELNISANVSGASRGIRALQRNLEALQDTVKHLDFNLIENLQKHLQDIANIDFSNVSQGLRDVVSAFKAVSQAQSRSNKNLKDEPYEPNFTMQESQLPSILEPNFQMVDTLELPLKNALEVWNDFKESVEEGIDASDIIDVESHLKTLEGELERAGFSYEQIKEVMRSTNAEAKIFSEEGIEKVKEILQQFGYTAEQANSIVNRLKTNLEDTGKVAKKSGENAKKGASGFEKIVRAFKRILFYRIIRRLIQEIGKALLEGVQNLATFDSNFNASISEIKSSLQYIGNSFVAMIAPLIQYITPLITTISNALSGIMQTLGEIFSAFTGNDYFYYAIKSAEDYAESLKKVKNQALGIDELNVINKDNNQSNFATSPITASDNMNAISSLGEKLNGFLNNLGEKFKEIFGKVKEIFEPLFDDIISTADTLIGSLDGVADTFTTFIGDLLEALSPLISEIGSFTSSITSSVGGFFEQLKPSIDGMLESFTGLVGTISGVISNLLERLSPVLDEILKALEPIMEDINNVIGDLLDSLNPIIEILGGLVGDLLESLGGFIADVLTKVEPLIQTLTGILSDVFGKISELFVKLQPLFDAVGEIFDGVLNAVSGIIGEVVDILGDIFDAVSPLIDSFSGILDPIIDLIVGTEENNHQDGLLSIVMSLFDLLEPFINSIKKIFAPVKDILSNVIKTVFGAFIDSTDEEGNKIQGIGKILRTVFSAITFLIENIVQPAFEALFGTISDTGEETGGMLSNLMGFVGDIFGLFDSQGTLGGIFSAIGSAMDYIKGMFTGDGTFAEILKVVGEILAKITKGVGGAVAGSLGIGYYNLPKWEQVLLGIASLGVAPLLGLIGKHANGGFVEDGLFMANHNELVGQFSNGKTAVANNEQITEGIYRAVLQAMNESERSGNAVISVQIDGREIARTVNKYNSQKGVLMFSGGNNYGN